jgi:hypothetical protein
MAAFDTIITGAGVSIPSGLWSGDRLAAEVWRACQRILDPAEGWTDWTEAGQDLADPKFGLRLEQFLEVLAGAFPSDPNPSRHSPDLERLMHVYDVFANAEPCALHWLVDTLEPEQILTLNMDLLHEAVNPTRPVVHLHGSLADHPAIKTLVSQYRRGLGPDEGEQLRRLVARKRVLAVGYSGRDRDVLPVIAAAGPSRLVWMLYQPSSASAPEVLDKDVLAVLKRLGSVLDLRPTTLPELVADVTGKPAPKFPTSTGGAPDPSVIDNVLGGIDASRLALGVAHVLFDLGRLDAARMFLKRADIGLRDDDARRVLIADCYRHLGHAWLGLFWSRPRLTRTLSRAAWSPYLGELVLGLRQTHLARLPLLLDWVLTARLARAEAAGSARPRGAAAARVRRAQDLIDAGRIRASLKLQADAARGSDLLVELPALADRRTWKIEALVLAGRRVQAQHELTQALRDEPYANRSQRTLLQWTAAHVSAEFGSPTDAIGSAQNALEHSRQSRSPRDQLWALLTYVDLAWRFESTMLRAELNECRRLARSDNGTALVHLHLLLADFARVANDLPLARRELSAARRASWHGTLRGRWFWPARRACSVMACALKASTPRRSGRALAAVRATAIAAAYAAGGGCLYARRTTRLAFDLLRRPAEVRTRPAPLLL